MNNKLEKILIIKSVILIILIIISLIMIIYIYQFNQNEKQNLTKYQKLMAQTHSQIMVIHKKEEIDNVKIKIEQIIEQKRIKIEEKQGKRTNTADLTPEQIQKIEDIFKPTNTKIVYLTFDDGPSTNVTPLILDTLKQHNIKATFFVIGTGAIQNPEVLKRIRAEGHYIGNHGYTHQYSKIYKSSQSVLNEYNQCEQIIREALGEPNYKTRIFRFPGGSSGGNYSNLKHDAREKLKQQNIAYLDWNCLTCDAEGTPTKQSIISNLKKTASGKNSLVILMHDNGSKILTYETLNEVILYLKEQGYTFGDMYELLQE